MKKLKMIISLVLIAALTAGLAITGTLAYLTDRDSEANVFTVGDVSIDLNEDFDQGAELIPGVEIEKKPTITNTGENDAWVWAEIAIPSELNSTASAAKNIIHFNMSAASVADGLWNWWDGEDYSEGTYFVTKKNIDGVDYDVYTIQYETALKPGETTAEPLIYKVYMDTHVDIDPEGNWAWVENGEVSPINWNVNEDDYPIIYVSAYAMQTDGFETVYDAYEAYNTQWADNGSEYAEPITVVDTVEEMVEVCKNGGHMILGKDITYTAENTEMMHNGSIFLINGKNVTLDLNGHEFTVAEDADQVYGAIFFVGNPGGHINIVGDGEITVENGVAPIVWTLQSGTANIYGGTYTSNSVSNEAMMYSQGNGGVINIYGGKYIYDLDRHLNGGFNVSDLAGNALRIVIHEGVLLSRPEYSQHLQGTTNGEQNRIQLAEGCTLEKVEIDGETWYKVAAMDSRVEYKGTTYETLAKAVEAANVNGGGEIKMLGTAKISETLTIGANITINGDGHQLLREEGFTGTMLTVNAGATLTTQDLTMDGGAVWGGTEDAVLQRGTTNRGVVATGNLIATNGNGSLVLDKGTVLKNNDGANAVSLATRGGGSMTLNGAQIIDNASAGGAIWGGGSIIINEGSKINGNYASSIGGAIRTVDNGGSVTMNGGEINHNKSDGTSGAIYGGTRITYNFYGGEMAYNYSAGGGGAIFSGSYNVFNISGDFKLHDNSSGDLGGAIRFGDHSSLNMTGGSVYNNDSDSNGNAFWLNNNSTSITGGSIYDNGEDAFYYAGGLGLTIGKADIEDTIVYELSTNHNTAYLAAEFNTIRFYTNKLDNFNFKPADGYVYTAGDENKLICQNEGYSTYWDAATSTFRLKAD